ncbi:hypothetical protein ONZ43_g3396 [Nemania bipapillata]|uniref:Uncharacterized protein n=1 Tax=Nemania bipapillata TaxID=110536 RepID=A0ACC2IWY8_9PEZI|nr:hypothetical protein ONZ43_g3396 [Nemania bipapillata]
MVRLLAESGANLRDTLPDGRSVLHLAATSPVEVLRSLLEFRKRIDLEQRDVDGLTALHYGLLCSAPEETIQLLVRAGADVNAQDNGGISPVGYAVSAQSLPSLKILLAEPETDADPDSNGRCPQPLIWACGNLSLDIVQLLLDRGANADAQWSKQTSDSPLVAALLGEGNTEANKYEDKDKIVRLLVNRGAQVSYKTWFPHGRAICRPLLAACMGANANIIHYLINEGASIQDYGPLMNPPIHFAAVNGIRNVETVVQVSEGDLLAADVADKTSLHWAAQFSHVETLKLILEKTTSSTGEQRRNTINLTDIDGWTPLAWATRPAAGEPWESCQSEPRDVTKTIQYLLAEGADPSVQFTTGQGDDTEIFTPLVMAEICNLPREAIDAIRDAQSHDGEAPVLRPEAAKEFEDPPEEESKNEDASGADKPDNQAGLESTENQSEINEDEDDVDGLDLDGLDDLEDSE